MQSNAPEVATNTPGAAITTGATASTKGSPVEIFAATNFDVWGVSLVLSEYGSGNTSSDAMLDFLIGSSGNEVPLIPNIVCGYSPLMIRLGVQRFWFPLFIPAGVRISARAAGRRTNTAMQLQVFLTGGTLSPPWAVGSRVTTYGVTSVPLGTSIVAGNGTQGAWTEITAATSEQHIFLVPSFQATNASVLADRAISVGYGHGASGSEVLAGTVSYASSNSEQISTPGDVGAVETRIPAGTRLVMRASTSASPDSYNGAIHGIT